MVSANDLSIDGIVSALADGQFYSPTGVTLSSYFYDDMEIKIEIQEEHDFIYKTVFSGKNGDVLAQTSGPHASYKITGQETYIRATVYSSSGGKAWTQPIFV